MRTVGIVAEYNPFHRGHALHLAKARSLSRADRVIAVMSGCFVQRGEPAVLPPRVRAEAALRNGVDLVVLLPCCWSLREAEHFALGAVSLLRDLGADCLSFGAETADLSLLEKAAAEMAQAVSRESLQAGQPWPQAMSAALSPDATQVLSSPNNLLGCCYLRAVRRLNAGLAAYPIARTGGYHAPEADPEQPSASAVRRLLLSGSWPEALACLPENTRAAVREAVLNHAPVAPDAFSQALLYRLRTMSGEEYAALPELSEGIENLLRKAAAAAAEQRDLLEAMKTRRYSRGRLARLCMHALLGIDAACLRQTPLPDQALVLGFRKEADGLLSRARIPLVLRRRDFDTASLWTQAEERAWDLYALVSGEAAGMLRRDGAVIV